jgi:hypothetical protein
VRLFGQSRKVNSTKLNFRFTEFLEVRHEVCTGLGRMASCLAVQRASLLDEVGSVSVKEISDGAIS